MWKQDEEKDDELTIPCDICGDEVLLEDTYDCESCGIVMCSSCMEGDLCIYCDDEREEKLKKEG